MTGKIFVSLFISLVGFVFLFSHLGVAQELTSNDSKASAVQDSVAKEEAIFYKGKDISNIVNKIKFYVKKTEKPYYLFNWSHVPEGTYDPISTLDPNDPKVLERAKSEVDLFMNYYGDANSRSGGTFGYGTYTFADPYGLYQGFGTPEWLLSVYILPKGENILTTLAIDLNRENLKDFGCEGGYSLDGLVSLYSQNRSSECRELIKFIFNEVLQISGFAYSYRGSISLFRDNSTGKACELSPEAIVLTSSKWLTNSNVRFFSRYSEHSKDLRVILETYFAKSIQIQRALYNSYNLKKDENPNMLSNEEFNAGIGNSYHDKYLKKLFWSDLEGVPKYPNIKQWAKESLYGCQK